MIENDYISGFSDYLYWDVDRSSINMEDNAPYIVGRVLELGQMSDWKHLLSYYGMDRIVMIAQNLRTLDPRALSFISIVSSTPKSTFRCCSKRQFR